MRLGCADRSGGLPYLRHMTAIVADKIQPPSVASAMAGGGGDARDTAGDGGGETAFAPPLPNILDFQAVSGVLEVALRSCQYRGFAVYFYFVS
jgi:hypothetical protein